MKIEKFTFNPFQENTYIAYDDTGECVIIDPGCYEDEENKQVVDFIEKNKLTPVKLLNTHCHIDHICGNSFVAKKWNLKLEASQLDEYNLELSVQAGKMYGVPIIPSPPIGTYLKEGDLVKFGNSSFQILFTPGHSAGSLSFYSSDDKLVLSGDVLFQMSIGRTDLPKGDFDTLIDSIKSKLFSLPPDTVVMSGHGSDTTIGYEKKNNPFLNP